MNTRSDTQPATGSTERLALSLLTAQIFFFALGLSLLEIAGTALFLVEFGADTLPWVYLAIAVVVSTFSYGYALVQKHAGLIPASIAGVVVFGGLLLAAWLGLLAPDSGWISFGLMIGLDLGYLVAFIVIGGQAGQLFDVRQMKRLFPVVLAGLIVGFMTGGLILPLLTQVFGATSNLLLPAVGSLLISLLLLLATARRFRNVLTRIGDTPATSSAPKATPPSLGRLLGRRYVRLLFTYQMLSAVGTQLVFFLFLDQAELRYPGVEDLTRFFGNFAIILNLLVIGFVTFVAGRLLRRFGLGLGLTIDPILVTAALVVMAIADAGIAPLLGLFFWLAAGARVIDNVLTIGTTSASVKSTYQALPARERPIVETAVEGIGIPVAFGIAGVILLAVDALGDVPRIYLTVLTLALGLLWTSAGFAVYRHYREALAKTLSRRALGDAAGLSLDDAANRKVVEDLLGRSELGGVRLALDMLERDQHPSLAPHLLDLVRRSEPELRAEALRRIERRRIGQEWLESALPAVTACLEQDREPAVREAALRAFGALAESEVVERLTAYLDDDQPRVRTGAMVGLLRHGGIPGILAAGERFTALEHSPHPAERIFAARVIGEVGVRSFYQPLLAHLRDEDPGVRRAALVAAARVRHPRLLEPVIDNLAHPATRSSAMSALLTADETILPFAAAALAAGEAHQAGQVIHLVRVCGQLGGERCIALLRRHLAHADDDVRYQVLLALDRCGFRARNEDDGRETAQAEVEAALKSEVEHALRILLTQQDLRADTMVVAERTSGATLRFLHAALEQELARVRRRAFLLLSFLHDASAILRAEEQLIWGSGGDQALALEMLDVTLSGAQKVLVFPLVHPKMSRQDRVRQLAPLYTLSGSSRQQRLAELSAEPPDMWTRDWIRTCARAALGSGEDGGEESLLAKVAWLKAADLFALTPEHALAPLATLAREVQVAPGEAICQRGAVADALYILIDGEARLGDDGPRLRPGDVTGELALVDPAPRDVAVRATRQSRWLRLDCEALRQEMTEGSEIARGMIRSLVRRFRELGHVAAPPTVAVSTAEIRRRQAGLLILEKVVLLKSVSIFTRVPEEELAAVASIVTEVEVDAGQRIIEQGELGTSMYIIAQGQVRVHDGERFLRYLEEREVFGELAALDPEPRIADVSAETDCLLFELGARALEELMAEHIDVAQGLIGVLCNKIRAAQKSGS